MRRVGIAVLLLVMVVTAGLVAGCSSSSKPTTPTSPTTPSSAVKKYTPATKNITAKVGDTFIIELPSNATTGYQWQITGPLSPAVQKVSQKYIAGSNPSSAVGVGGVQDFTFKAVSAGDALIQLEYLQAGSNTNGGTAVFNVTVK